MEERPGIERRKKVGVKESQKQAAENEGEEAEPVAALGLAHPVTGPAAVITQLQLSHSLLPGEWHTGKWSSLQGGRAVSSREWL